MAFKISANTFIDDNENILSSGGASFQQDITIGSSPNITLSSDGSSTFSGISTFSSSVNISGNLDIAGSIIPSEDNTYDLGSPTKMWRDVYIGPGSLYVNGQKIVESDDTDNIIFSASSGQNLVLKPTGIGDLELAPEGGIVQVKSALQIQDGTNITNSAGNAISFSNNISSPALLVNEITSKSADGDLVLSGSGSGIVRISDGLDVVGTVDASSVKVNGVSVNTSTQVDSKISTAISAIPATDLSGYDTSTEVDAKIAAIPATDLSAYNTSTQVDSKISTAINAIPDVDLSGYDTSAEVTDKVNALETSLTAGAPGALDTLNELAASLGDDANFASTMTNSLASKADISSLATVATSGSYTHLSNKPTIPTHTSHLTNNSGYITSADGGDASTLNGQPGSYYRNYNNLINKPSFVSPTGSGASGIWAISITGSANSANTATNADKLDGQQGSYYLNYSNLINKPTLGTAAVTSSSAYATAAQGTKADTALQSYNVSGVTFAGGDFEINETGHAAGKVNIDSTSDGGNSAWGLSVKNNDSRQGRPSLRLQNAGNGNAVEIKNAGGTAVTTTITTAGAATFAGVITNTVADNQYAYQIGTNAAKGGLYNHANGGYLFLKDSSSVNKIILNGANGSATFNSSIQSGEYAADAAGSIQIFNNTESAQAFKIGNTTNGSNIAMKSDGSAEFAGSVQTGDQIDIYRRTTDVSRYLLSAKSNVGGAGQIKFDVKADGSAEFAGSVESKNNFFVNAIADGQVCFRTIRNGVNTALINGNGSAEFADNVSVDKYLTVTNSALSSDARVQIQGDQDVAISVYPTTAGARTIELKHDGSAEFADIVKGGAFHITDSKFTSEADELIRIIKSGERRFIVRQNGSATFAGDVYVENTPSPTIRIIGTGQGTALFGQGWDRAPGGNTGAVIAADNGPIVFRRGVAYNGDPGDTAAGTTAMFIHQDTGNVYIGGDIDTDVTNRNIELKSDGSAEFAGAVNTESFKATSSTNAYFLNNGDGLYYYNTSGSNTGYILADGSATFAGSVQAGGNAQSGTAVGTRLNSYGAVHAARTNDSDVVWGGYKVGNSTPTSQITADGSASFAGGNAVITDTGNVKAGPVDTSKGSTLSNTGQFGVRNDDADGTVRAISVYKGGQGSQNALVDIRYDGSATFAGNVQVQTLSTDASGGQITSNYNLVTTSTNSAHGIFIGCTDSTSAAVGNSNASITGDGSASFAGGQLLINSTGSLRLGNPNSFVSGGNIILGAGGTGLFTGDLRSTTTVTCSDNVTNTAFLNHHGLQVRSSTGPFLKGEDVSANQKVLISADGSATFAGSVKYGGFGYISEGDLGTLYSGSASGSYGIIIGTEPGSTSSAQRKISFSLGAGGASEVASIGSDGSATFTGSVESKNNFFVNAIADDQVCFRTIRSSVNTATINGDGKTTLAGGSAFNAANSTFATDLVIGDGNGSHGLTIFTDGDSDGILNFARGTSGNDRWRGTIKYDHNDTRFNFVVEYGADGTTNPCAQIGNSFIWTRGSLQARNGYVYLGDEDVADGVISSRESVGIVIDSNNTTSENERFYIKSGAGNTELFRLYESGNAYITGIMSANGYSFSNLQELV